jgi:hypothetical protein
MIPKGGIIPLFGYLFPAPEAGKRGRGDFTIMSMQLVNP